MLPSWCSVRCYRLQYRKNKRIGRYFLKLKGDAPEHTITQNNWEQNMISLCRDEYIPVYTCIYYIHVHTVTCLNYTGIYPFFASHSDCLNRVRMWLCRPWKNGLDSWLLRNVSKALRVQTSLQRVRTVKWKFMQYTNIQIPCYLWILPLNRVLEIEAFIVALIWSPGLMYTTDWILKYSPTVRLLRDLSRQ
jgi:hypothetical protein